MSRDRGTATFLPESLQRVGEEDPQGILVQTEATAINATMAGGAPEEKRLRKTAKAALS